MADKHTPGPWETGQAHWNEDGDVMYPLHGIKEAKVADCRLVAAAPDLLALAYQYRDDLRHPPSPDSRERRLAAIDAAIAKAEGRS